MNVSFDFKVCHRLGICLICVFLGLNFGYLMYVLIWIDASITIKIKKNSIWFDLIVLELLYIFYHFFSIFSQKFSSKSQTKVLNLSLYTPITHMLSNLGSQADPT